jgi:hypothetical protein
MFTLLLLVTSVGIVPLAVAVARLKPERADSTSLAPLGSILLATLAFNLTFFWQELWLAIPKALTPGLHPVLYHNNHDWTGNSSIVELLQGTGAIATMVSGLAFTAILAPSRKMSPTWQVFVFWMAFQGLFQSLSQFAIGAVIPGNDVGRALAYLGFSSVAHAALLAATVAAMALAGRLLAVRLPAGVAPRTVFGTWSATLALCSTGVASVLLSIPLRIPRNIVEVLLIPAIVNLFGVAWLIFGTTLITRGASNTVASSPAAGVPAALLLVLLVFFQAVLRLGVPI